jgi:hypothetical protein
VASYPVWGVRRPFVVRTVCEHRHIVGRAKFRLGVLTVARGRHTWLFADPAHGEDTFGDALDEARARSC